MSSRESTIWLTGMDLLSAPEDSASLQAVRQAKLTDGSRTAAGFPVSNRKIEVRDRIALVGANRRLVMRDRILERAVFEQQIADVREGGSEAWDDGQSLREVTQSLLALTQADVRDATFIVDTRALVVAACRM